MNFKMIATLLLLGSTVFLGACGGSEAPAPEEAPAESPAAPAN